MFQSNVANLVGSSDAAGGKFPQHVQVLDSSGNVVDTFGGDVTGVNNTEYTEGATDATLTGIVAMAEGSGDAAQPLQVDASKNLKVAVQGSAAVTNAGTFAVQADSVIPGTGATNLGKAEDAAHSSGDTGVMVLAVRNDAGTALAGTTGDYIPLSTDSSGALRVVGSSGTTQYAEDSAHASGDSAVFVAGIRRDTTPSSSAGTAGDYTALNVDANGRLYTQTVLYNSAGTEITADTQGTQDGALGTITSVTGAMAMGRASTAVPTAVSADDDAVLAWHTRTGAQVVTAVPHTTGGLSTFMASGSDGSSILVATAQAIKASAGQMYGYYLYNPEAAVTFVHFYNTAAASVTVGTTNPLFTIPVPAGAAANLMFPHGVTFSNAGWSCAATTTAGGNTAPATGVSAVIWYA